MAKRKRKRDKKRKPLIRARTLRRWLVGGVVLAGVVALSAVCITAFGGGNAGDSQQEPVISDEAQVPVTIQGFTFQPDDLTVGVGTEIVWENRDGAPHTATGEGEFDSGQLERGDSYTFTFDEPGTYEYICEIHPYMTATIVVTEGLEQQDATPDSSAS